MPGGPLRHVLLPQTFGPHEVQGAAFTVLSVEIWATGIVINIHLAGMRPFTPEIVLEDHHGTAYSLENSETLGSRNLQVFTPSVPAATRSLTIRSSEGDEARLVVTLAVPPTTGSAGPEGLEPFAPEGA
jgi:hypothetical protein